MPGRSSPPSPAVSRTGLLHRVVELPLRAPRAILVAAGLLTALFAARAPFVRIDGSIDSLLVTGDPERAVHAEAERVFGSDELTRIGLFADDVFAPATLARIDRLSRALARIEGVDDVVSLTTITGVEMTPEGLRAGRVMRELPRTAEAGRRFRRRVLDDPLYRGTVVAADGRATAVTVLYEPMSDETFAARGIEAQVRAAVAASGGPEETAISGIPTLKVKGAERMEHDIRLFSAIGIALVAAVLVVTFRSARGVALPLLAVVLGVTWTNGLMALLDRPITIGTLVLNPLLMAIGVAYAIHVMSRHQTGVDAGLAPAEAVRATLRHVARPVTGAAVTTVLAFATLAPHPIPTIRDLGLWSIFGIVVIFLASLTVIPAILVLLPPPAPSRSGGEPRLDRVLARFAALAVGHSRRVVLVGAALCAASVAGIAGLRVETDYLGFFPPESEVRRDAARIAGALAGSHALYVLLDGDAERAITRPPSLDAIRRLQTLLEARPGVERTMSIVDYLARAREAIEPGLGRTLPESQEEADQILALTNLDDLRQVVNRDQSRANVVVYTNLSASADLRALVDAVEGFAATLPPGLSAHATGTAILLNRTSDDIAAEQVLGLGRMILVLFAVLCVLFRSVRVGLLSLVPNVVPIVLLFGLMGATGVPLNVSTAMIAVIALGIAVDDTIHYLAAFADGLDRRGEPAAAVRDAIHAVGRPIVFTSIALAAGFLVSCLSGFEPVRQFGALSAVTMLIALFADLVLTPAIAMASRLGGAGRAVAPNGAVEESIPRTGGLHG